MLKVLLFMSLILYSTIVNRLKHTKLKTHEIDICGKTQEVHVVELTIFKNPKPIKQKRHKTSVKSTISL